MRIAIVSSSLAPQSKSLILGRLAAEFLAAQGHAVDSVDLSGLDLPQCGAEGSFTHPGVLELSARIGRAEGILLASPVYNYDVNAAAKNFVELTGRAWEGKAVGLLLCAGGHASYMSGMSFVNSLMLDFRCVIVPRFVYAVSNEHFSGTELSDPETRRRVEALTKHLALLAGVPRAD